MFNEIDAPESVEGMLSGLTNCWAGSNCVKRVSATTRQEENFIREGELYERISQIEDEFTETARVACINSPFPNAHTVFQATRNPLSAYSSDGLAHLYRGSRVRGLGLRRY